MAEFTWDASMNGLDASYSARARKLALGRDVYKSDIVSAFVGITGNVLLIRVALKAEGSICLKSYLYRFSLFPERDSKTSSGLNEKE